jgi:hypothetical protein
MIVRALAGGGGALAVGVVFGALFVAPAPGGCGCARALGDVPAHPRPARPLRDHLHVVAAALYFSLGVVAQRALGLTPVVFLVAGCSSCSRR